MPLALKNEYKDGKRETNGGMQKKARVSTKRKTRQKKMEMLKKIFTKTSHHCGKKGDFQRKVHWKKEL